MIITQEMILSIINLHDSDNDVDLASCIASELTAIQDTERWLRDADAEEKMLREEHRKAIREIEEQRAEVLKQCSHHSASLNDVGIIRVCDTCGKVF